MKYLVLSLILSSFNALAADCNYSVTESKVMWTAFKTPQKVGVNGGFTKFNLTTSAAKDKVELIKKATFNIDTTSINTGNPGRDNTIRNNFFTSKKKPMTIKGHVISATQEATTALIEIDGTKKEVVFKNTITDDKLLLEGSIDVLDFKLNSNFNALHKACKALHEGKTWTDVNISIEASLKSQCK